METGGKTRIKVIFPSLIISSLKLAKRYYDKRSQVSEQRQQETEGVIEEQKEEPATADVDDKSPAVESVADKEEEERIVIEGENSDTTTIDQAEDDAEKITITGDVDLKTGDVMVEDEQQQQHQQKEDEWFKKMETLYRFIHQLVMILLRECDNSESQCVQFSLMAANNADYCKFDEVAFNFFLDAFKIYEESVSHSKAQFNAIVYSIGSLLKTSTRLQQHAQRYYNVLSTKITLYCTKLLKKPDQSRSIYLASHLWVTDTPFRVLECLQKSLKIADSCMDIATNELLFIELLNQYLYYYEQENPMVSSLSCEQ